MIPVKKRLIPLYEHLATNFLGKKFERPGDKIAYIFLAADQNNLGDLAIRQAQEWFLKEILPKDYTVVSITQNDTYLFTKSIRKQLKAEDIILLQGGGSFGDLYPKADYGRIFLCKYFKHKPIVSLPQTIFFSKSNYGRWRKSINRKSISKLSNLILATREQKSYRMAQKLFNNNKVILAPDIVLSLLPKIRERHNQDKKRSGIIVTFRSDTEKYISDSDSLSIMSVLKSSSNIISKIDTDNGGDRVITTTEGFKKVTSLLDKYSSAKLVVTDRLHGMIFAAITGTPCIVLPNSNHKIKETYTSWLHICNYIVFSEKFNEKTFAKQVKRMTGNSFTTNYGTVSFSFKNLEECILKTIGN